MFGALGRWFKAVMYLMTGRFDAARRTLDTNPHVVRAKYDEIIRDKMNRIQMYKQAVATMIAQQEEKMSKVKTLTQDIGKLENLKAGALAKAKQAIDRLQKTGKSKEECQQDADYQKCLAAYNDFSSTLAEKQARIAELETDIESYTKRIGEHKVQLQQLLRDLENIKVESADAVADIITAKQEKEIGDTLAGIATDGTAQELQRMRELRREVKAEARISKELGGVDARAQEAEFLEYARKNSSNDEFDNLIGLSKEKDVQAKPDSEKPAAAAESASKLPE